MQDCMRKVETKAVMTVRMKLPSFSALGILKNFIFAKKNYNNSVMQGDALKKEGASMSRWLSRP